MQHLCNTHATVYRALNAMQHLCNTHATLMQHAHFSEYLPEEIAEDLTEESAYKSV
jgi:hypothetical protein